MQEDFSEVIRRTLLKNNNNNKKKTGEGKWRVRMMVEEFQAEGVIPKDTKVREGESCYGHWGIASCLVPN